MKGVKRYFDKTIGITSIIFPKFGDESKRKGEGGGDYGALKGVVVGHQNPLKRYRWGQQGCPFSLVWNHVHLPYLEQVGSGAKRWQFLLIPFRDLFPMGAMPHSMSCQMQYVYVCMYPIDPPIHDHTGRVWLWLTKSDRTRKPIFFTVPHF